MSTGRNFEASFYAGLGMQSPEERTLDLSYASVLDPHVRVDTSSRTRVFVSFSNERSASGFVSWADQNMEDVDVEFDPTLLGYEPEPDLVRKSANPLWVMRKLDNATVSIERLW